MVANARSLVFLVSCRFTAEEQQELLVQPPPALPDMEPFPL